MKRVVSVLLLVCMLVSLMGMSVAAYAEENVEGAVNTEQVPNPPAADPIVTASPEPTPEPTPTPTPEVTPESTATPEVTEQPQTTEKPADTEGFFAALSDAEVATLTTQLAALGCTVTDRAGLYALAVQHNLGDLNSFYAWLASEQLVHDAVAEVNGKFYLTLDDALEALTDFCAEIKLLKDTTVVGFLAPVEHELTLDLNGYKLTLAPYDDATPSYITVDEADKQSNDNPPVKTHVHSALIIKNGIVNASYENAYAIVNKGALTLIKVDVCGDVYVGADDGAATLSVESDSYLCGNLDAEKGKYKSVSITGGKFLTDVSAYIDSSVYECTQDETTKLYTVARIKGTSADADTTDESTDKTGKTDPNSLPDIEKTEVKKGEVTLAKGVELKAAAVELTGLDNALGNTGVADIIDTYNDTTPATAPEVTDGTELTLTVKAEVTAAEEGSYVSYDIKPIAVINDTEVEIDNNSLSQTMRLSFYTGFMPAVVKHIHDDGTVDTLNSTMYSYDKTTGMVTVETTSFSAFAASDGELKTEIENGTETEITLSGDVTITSSNAPINVSRDLTIILNGHTLSMDSAVAAGTSMFTVASGKTLTIKGNNVANSALTITNSSGTATCYIASLADSTSTLILGDASPVENTATFTASYPVPTTITTTSTGVQKVTYTGKVNILCAKTSFDPRNYVTEPYATNSDGTSGNYVVDEYEVKLEGTTTAGTAVTYFHKLADALAAAKESFSTTEGEIDKITLLKDIDEGNITIDKSIIIDGQSKYGITGNVTVSGGSSILKNMSYITGKIAYTASTTVVSLTLSAIDTIGDESTKTDNVIEVADNVTLNVTKCSNIYGSIKAGSSPVNINSNLLAAAASTTVTGSVTAGTGNLTVKKTTVNGDIKSIGTSTGSPLRSVSIENSSANSIIVAASEPVNVNDKANASFTATNVIARDIAVGSADTALAARSVSITECTVTNDVTIGDGFNTVSVTGLTGDGAATNSLSVGTCRTVGTSTGEITIEGTSSKNMWINTVNIADGNKNVSIKGISQSSPTVIGTVNLKGSSDATFGEVGASSDKIDVKLQVGQIICENGTATINNGTYGKDYTLDDATVDSLNIAEGGTGTFALNGGLYHRDYGEYCDCTLTNDGSTEGTHYTHKECKLDATTIRDNGKGYRVITLAPVVIAPASKEAAGSITRGTQTNLTFVTDAPYDHECTGNRDLFGVQVDNVYLTEGTQYTVAPYTYTHDGITETVTQVTLLGSYVGSLTATTHRINLDTEVGKATSYADGNPVQIKVTLATTNRSGIIRTGDDSNIGLLIGIMVLALAVVVAVVIILKKKKTQTSAPAQPEAKAKEKKEKKKEK